MSIVTRDELMPVISHRDGVCLSIFMPAHRAGIDVQQDPVRLKNLIKQAEGALEEHGQRASLADELLQPARKLLDDDAFWRHQSDGLAVFASRSVHRSFRVPIALEEMVVVGSRFQVKPLLPLLTGEGIFFVLAISQNQVRLLQCTRDSCREVEVPGMPSSMAEALQFDDNEKQAQVRQVPAGSTGGGIFHGHGVGQEHVKDQIKRFLQMVDRGLKDVLADQKAPMVLAAVDYKQAIYHQINSYPHLLPKGIVGSPDEMKPEQLRQLAYKEVTPVFEAVRKQVSDDTAQAVAKGQAATRIDEIVRAASDGRISVIFCPLGREVWGKFEPDSGSVGVNDSAQPGDEDLLNLAAIQTVVHGGTVYVVPPDQMPGGMSVAALLRY